MRIHHLALRTSDLPRLERFYAGVLSLEVVRRDGARSVWLDAAGTTLMLERSDAGEPAVDGRSMELVCFAVSPDAHAGVIERLDAAGIAVEGRTAFSLYFRDPDGRRVGVSSYPAARAAPSGG